MGELQGVSLRLTSCLQLDSESTYLGTFLSHTDADTYVYFHLDVLPNFLVDTLIETVVFHLMGRLQPG